MTHYIRAMKNVTIRMEEDVARWVRIHAAEHDTSVSRMLGELLKQRMKSDKSYEQAKRQFFSREPKSLKAEGVVYPDRAAVYER